MSSCTRPNCDGLVAPGHSSWCRPCLNEYQRNRNKELGNRFLRYGLSKEDLLTMWLLQGGRCDICKNQIEIDTCNVDHDNSCCDKETTKQRRSCGKCVRALLCHFCNTGLGGFRDNVYNLTEAIAFLNRLSRV